MIGLCLLLLGGGSPVAGALLSPHPTNPRYLWDGQNVILMTGSHNWYVYQDYAGNSPLDFNGWLLDLVAWGHGFTRGWMHEDAYHSPIPHAVSEGLFDLEAFDPAYSALLRARIQAFAAQGLHTSVMLFQGWSVSNKNGLRAPHPWPAHPFHPDNNLNGVDGDTNSDGRGLETQTLAIPRVTELQEAYLEHMVDALHDLDNFFWEISNESDASSVAWQYAMIQHLQSYEQSTYGRRHLVWMSCPGSAPNSTLFASPADIVSPCASGGYEIERNGGVDSSDPPVADGSRIVLADSDHLRPLNVNHRWAWKSFLRGHQPLFMDLGQPLAWWQGTSWNPSDPDWQRIRNALGAMRSMAQEIDLARMAPQRPGTDSPVSDNGGNTNFALFSTAGNPTSASAQPDGLEYLAYEPDGEGELEICGLKPGGGYRYQWHDSQTGLGVNEPLDTGPETTACRPFMNEARRDRVLWLRFLGWPPTADLVSDPTHAVVAAPHEVSFDASKSSDPEGQLVAYEWDFDGDGAVDATGQAVQHVFATPGLHEVSLTVTDSQTLRAHASTLFDVGLAPTIGVPPMAQGHWPGATAVLSVVAEGTPPFEHQWLRGGSIWVPLADDPRVSGATAGTLLIAGLTPSDADMYRCVISNAYGETTTAPVQLHVVPPLPVAPVVLGPSGPQFATTPQLAWQDVTGAATFEFELPGSGHPGGEAPAATACSAGRCEVEVPLPVGPYEWRVRAANLGGESPWSGSSGLEILECDAAPGLSLEDAELAGVETVTDCQTISATGVTVLSGADLALHAGESIALDEGFVVESGARLTLRVR